MSNIDFSDEIKKLPGSVHSCANLRQALVSGEATASEISDMLSIDPILAARVLKLANSPFFATGHSVTSLKQAVIMLGQRVISHLVLTASFNILLESDILQPPITAENFWRHSLASAYISKKVAGKLGSLNPDEAFTLGLLHDVGLFLMMLKFKKIHASIMSKLGDTESGESREYKLFKTSHAKAGKVLFERWHIPDDMVLAVENHHNENFNSPLNFISHIEEWTVVLGFGLIEPKLSKSCPNYFFYKDIKLKTEDLIENINRFIDENNVF